MGGLLKAALAALLIGAAITGCSSDATVATENIKRAADNFEITRRVVFYNGITDSYMLSVEGRCSMDLNSAGTAFNVICKTGPSEYKRHTLVLSDNTSAFVEQLESANVSAYHYRVVFKPQSIVPDVDFRGDMGELTNDRH
ncbi:beta-sandwich lipoprotein [Pseudaminobacter sp. NGMCC 1.201702]|uniref:beta-sandwich lipoprotein n=1 Tax=Pseudaminobacter sp. NGMCC 1.201702 TaxID=3391825 RepID=UPI0039F0A085